MAASVLETHKTPINVFAVVGSISMLFFENEPTPKKAIRIIHLSQQIIISS